VASSATAANFTWSGAASAGEAKWSNATNWSGTAPSGSVGTLEFPKLEAGCEAEHLAKTCYVGENDVSGLTVNTISIDDGVPYHIKGNAITLGAGGITAKGAASSGPLRVGPTLEVPITLSTSQTWSIDGGNGLLLQSGVSGSTDALEVKLSHQGGLALGNTDVGPITVTSAGFSEFGLVMFGTSLNGTDGNPVSVSGGAGLLIESPNPSSMGPLTMSGGALLIGQGTTPDTTLAVKGGVKLDSASQLRLDIDHAGTTPGTDFSQLSATGAVNLEGASLLILGPIGGGKCPALTVGEAFTLVTTTGSLEGTFAGVPDGGIVGVDCGEGYPLVRINYTAHTVTATVVPSHQLKVSISGGEGEVSGSGISCNTIGAEPYVCSESLPVGTIVALTASPLIEYMFSGWSGACAGTGPCSLTMSSDQTVTANFAPTPATCPSGQTGTPPNCQSPTNNNGAHTSSVQPKAPTGPPAPILGQQQTATASSGTVTVRVNGTSAFVPLSGAASIPDGSEVDTTNGRATITVATPQGGTASAEVYGGRFRIHQDATGETHFILSLPLTGCPRVVLPRGSAAALAARAKHHSGPTSRHLWVSENGGSWATNGRYVSTSVEGTTWLTLDECTRSQVEVTAGRVLVHDLVHNKTKTVSTGKRYIAAGKSKRRRP
jgi:hypothetical protein